jgi:hypothetical protein
MGSRGAVRGGEAKSEEDSRVRLKAGLGGFVLGGKNGLGPGAVHAGPRLYRETRPGVSQLPIEVVKALVFQVEAIFLSIVLGVSAGRARCYFQDVQNTKRSQSSSAVNSIRRPF